MLREASRLGLFTGEQYDEDSGLYYLRARHYDPATGRFLSQDPLPLGNRYSYVGNNPVNYVDPYGLFGLGFIDDIAECVADPLECAEEVAEEAGETASSVYHDPAGAVTYLDGVALTIDLYAAAITDTAAAIGCTLGPGGCVAGYLSGLIFVAPGLLVSNGISALSAVITCADWTGVIGDKEGSSFTDCAVSVSTSYVGFTPEPNINAAVAGYQLCYDVGRCHAWWGYGPWKW
jgi:RHS repeat-associated protein